MWDRSKQTYFIARNGSKVVSIDGKRIVGTFPIEKTYDTDFVEKICFAESDEKVREILTKVS